MTPWSLVNYNQPFWRTTAELFISDLPSRWWQLISWKRCQSRTRLQNVVTQTIIMRAVTPWKLPVPLYIYLILMKDNLSYEKCCVLKCMNTWDTDVDSQSFFVLILRELLWLSVVIQNGQVCSHYQGYKCGESIHQSRLLCIWRSFTATCLGSCIRSDYQADMVLKKACHLEHLTSLYTFYV